MGDIRELMRAIPYQQFKAWMLYLDEQWDTPSRTDHYLMALRSDLSAIFGTRGKLEDYLIKFTRRQEKKKLTKEAIAWSKACWKAALMMTGTGGPRPGGLSKVAGPELLNLTDESLTKEAQRNEQRHQERKEQ